MPRPLQLRYVVSLVALFAAAASAQFVPPLRTINRTVDVSKIETIDTIDWFQADDVEYNVWLIYGSITNLVVLASNETPTWIASSGTNAPVIYTNGIIKNATNGGPLSFTLHSPDSALDYRKLYDSAVILARAGFGTNIHYDVADRTRIKIIWRPTYQGQVTGPKTWTNGVLDDFTLVDPTFWQLHSQAIWDAVGGYATNGGGGSFSGDATSLNGRSIQTSAPAAVDDVYLWDGNMWSARAVRVTGANITDGSIGNADLAAGSVLGLNLGTGTISGDRVTNDLVLVGSSTTNFLNYTNAFTADPFAGTNWSKVASVDTNWITAYDGSNSVKWASKFNENTALIYSNPTPFGVGPWTFYVRIINAVHDFGAGVLNLSIVRAGVTNQTYTLTPLAPWSTIAETNALRIMTGAWDTAMLTYQDGASNGTTQFLDSFSFEGTNLLTNSTSITANRGVFATVAGNGSGLTDISGATIADGTISNADLAAGSVNSNNIIADAVNGAKVKDGSLSSNDLDAATQAAYGAFPHTYAGGADIGLVANTSGSDTNKYLSQNGTWEADKVGTGGAAGDSTNGWFTYSDATLTAATASVVFGPLPQGFSKIQLEIFARGDTAAMTAAGYLRLNNDTNAVYNFNYYYQTGGDGRWSTEFDQTAGLDACGAPAGTSITGLYGHVVITIDNYAATNMFKQVTIWAYREWGTSANQSYLQIGQVLWKSYAAVTSAAVTISPGSYDARSRFIDRILR